MYVNAVKKKYNVNSRFNELKLQTMTMLLCQVQLL